mgnify:CR=1 FL=1
MESDIIKISHLNKSFSEVKAVNDLSFRVKKRRIVCVSWSKRCREKYNHFHSLRIAEKKQRNGSSKRNRN